MLNPIRERKLSHLFHILDRNHDGVLSRQDFEQVIEEITNIRQWKWGTSEYEELHFFWMGFCNRLEVWADRNGDGKVTESEWLWYLEQMLDRFSASYIQQVFINISLKVMDFSRDDRVSLDEFKQFYQIYEIDPQEAAQAFVHLDLNQDGYLTKDELTSLFQEFFYSENPQSPGNWLWGNIDG
ncbi:EF-hand domain-containing protein [Crocosphaera watsonii]|uniref:Juvenile hormone diol kinase n=1 Tax=Crocosphaera watsonii WH 8502 TaxID=423474 RepID=T2IFV0_CROWT|nr:EF-hand domain-containing protein [Crocosphaera watsonii]CCQ51918.1 Juvenile hormone diol kinase [Crocosphaera watsonii WH 8502]